MVDMKYDVGIFFTVVSAHHPAFGAFLFIALIDNDTDVCPRMTNRAMPRSCQLFEPFGNPVVFSSPRLPKTMSIEHNAPGQLASIYPLSTTSQ